VLAIASSGIASLLLVGDKTTLRDLMQLDDA
jgi:hypothetical protein